MVGAGAFPVNFYDGPLLAAELEQTTILLEDVGRARKEVVVDLGFRRVDADNLSVEIIHRGKYKRLSWRQRRRLIWQPAVELAMGHLKADHRRARYWLKRKLGNVLHAVLRAAGYNLDWLTWVTIWLGAMADHLLRRSWRALAALLNGFMPGVAVFAS
jgi:IS5 family transposase